MDETAIRKVSHALFGNSYLLEVAVGIAQHPKARFTQQEVSKAIGIGPNLVAVAMAKLEKSGLVERTAPDGRERPFQLLPSAFWAGACSFLDELLRSD